MVKASLESATKLLHARGKRPAATFRSTNTARMIALITVMRVPLTESLSFLVFC